MSTSRRDLDDIDPSTDVQTPLFDLEPAPLAVGDRVLVQTIWGTEEATVVALTQADGFPMAQVQTTSGDLITINVARLSPVTEG